jgi:hypothetical protein
MREIDSTKKKFVASEQCAREEEKQHLPKREERVVAVNVGTVSEILVCCSFHCTQYFDVFCYCFSLKYKPCLYTLFSS